MSLLNGTTEKREKLLKLFGKHQLKVSVLSFLIGVAWFFILPHQQHVHRTYISENALLPGRLQRSINFLAYVKQNKKLNQIESDQTRVGKWSKWSFVVSLGPYCHSLRYIHHTGLLDGLNHHQCHQSLQYFTMVLDDHDRNIICDHMHNSRSNSDSNNLIYVK
jgi:hypothetical protein